MSLEAYVPILMFMIVALAFGCVLLIVGWVASPSRPDPDKMAPYECGFEAFEDAFEAHDSVRSVVPKVSQSIIPNRVHLSSIRR